MSISERTTNTPDSFALWSDDPSAVDLLSFNAVAETAEDALLDHRVDPIALGLSGSWGSGKTTVLNLIASCLAARGGAGIGLRTTEGRG
jgi:pantothenate kinase-related protein Tda10